MEHRTQQRGVSMIGFLFVAAVVVVVAMLGFRVTPAYIEQYSIQRALEQALIDAKDLNSAAEVRAAFQKRADAGYIESVNAKDIEVTKTRNEITASVSWTRKLHLVANASLFLEFEATATR
jgi:Tfp pilus assembly protein PilV